jgi:hypothetical protein
MPLISHVLFSVKVYDQVPQRMAEQWSASLQAEAGSIAEKCQTTIPNEEKFKTCLAEPSSQGYKNFVSKDFCSRGGLRSDEITARQSDNLKKSYDKYQLGMEQAYGQGGEHFKNRVAASQTAYARGAARKLYAFTGTKLDGRGPAPLAALWLSGDIKTINYSQEGSHIIEGGPFSITRQELRPALKSSLNQRLIQAGATIVTMSYDPEEIKRQNDSTNNCVNSFVDPELNLNPFTTGGASCVDYIIKFGQLHLEIKVSQK